jgi:hypothetical protein
MQYTAEMASYGIICVPSFLKIYTVIHAILSFGLAVRLVLLMERIYEVCLLNGLRWHDTRTRFHDERFRQ